MNRRFRIAVWLLAGTIFTPGMLHADLYFPPSTGPWETTTPADAGLIPAHIQSAVAYAEENNTSSLLIVHHGRIVSENHWDPKSSPRYKRMLVGASALGHPIEDVASVQKSVISFLAGVAIGEEKLDLDTPVTTYLGKGWSSASESQENAITVRHLMTMTTGLGNKLEYEIRPDARWKYNTASYSLMVPVLEKVFGEPIDTITKERISSKIGMTDTAWRERRWAQGSDIANSVGLATTARDLARFGILIQAKGIWNGELLITAPRYLDESTSSSQNMNPSYGFLWWLNGKSSYQRPVAARRVPGPMSPSAPSDMVGAYGALGRKVYISRDTGLVVVRLGDDPGADFDDAFWSRMLTGR